VAASLLLTASVAEAAFPGRDGRIAFVDLVAQQLFAIDPGGTGLVQLTHFPAGTGVGEPDWSADGRHIAFGTNAIGEERLWIMDADGSHQHVVFDDAPGFRDHVPRYTPDGRTLVFARCQPGDGVCAIWAVGVDGRGAHAITPYQTGRHEAVDYFDTVSPDGSTVAFVRFGANGITAQLYVVPIGGGAARAITPPAIAATQPSFTADGRHVLFAANAQRNGGDVAIVGVDASGLRRLTATRYPHNAFFPAGSPSGRHLVFVTDQRYPDQCCVDLVIRRVGGSGAQRLPVAAAGPLPFQPAWGSAPPLGSASTVLPAAVRPGAPWPVGWCLGAPPVPRLAGACAVLGA
jgi:Tol biopolymer transport system component